MIFIVLAAWNLNILSYLLLSILLDIKFLIIFTISLYKNFWLYFFQLFCVLLAFFLHWRSLLFQKFKSFLNSVKIFLHLVMVTSTLISIPCLDKLWQSFKYFPLPTRLFFTKFFFKFPQESKILSILFLRPVTCLI